MKAVRPVEASNGVPSIKIRLVGSHSSPRKQECSLSRRNDRQVQLYLNHRTEICPRYDNLLSVLLEITVYPELCKKYSGGTHVQFNFGSH